MPLANSPLPSFGRCPACRPAGGLGFALGDCGPYALAWLMRFACCISLFSAGCSLTPSNDRDWAIEQAVLPYAELNADTITVHHIRDFEYATEETYRPRYQQKSLKLADVQTVDFVLIPFATSPTLAHTMLSFGLADGDHLAVSVEIRKEKGEVYSPVKGFFNQYELMYVVGSEQDLIGLRANHRRDDVYVYPTKATPEQAQALFVNVFERVNELALQPEFYNTVANNCTTNLVTHVNDLAPGKIHWGTGVLLPGLSDKLAFDAGLLATDMPFEETRANARVNVAAFRYRHARDFSKQIRR